ncbi:MAG: permease [Thermodesulfobacteriota bacterium]
MKNQDNPFTFRGKYFLLVVLIFYGVLFFFNSQTAQLALLKSSSVLKKILPILMFVILFTAVLNFFLQPKQIANHLDRESGIKAWIWALVAGVISHGPMYVWYPMLENLRFHGMRDGLIVVFFASRTIKIPLIPMMIDYFGWAFTLILSFYILIGALVQGLILENLTQNSIDP